MDAETRAEVRAQPTQEMSKKQKPRLTADDIADPNPFYEGQKITLVKCGGGGFMGVDSTQELVVKQAFGTLKSRPGPARNFTVVAKPRAKNRYGLRAEMESGAIVLDGHLKSERDIMESDTGRFMMDGRGGRFYDNGEGAEATAKFLAEHCVCHTLDRLKYPPRIVLQSDREDVLLGDVAKPFPELLATLPPALCLSEEVEEIKPAPPPHRHPLLTVGLRTRLLTKGPDAEVPIVKIFNPSGEGTWLLCGLDSDGDTLVGYADLGFGCVEYGPISLNELETFRSQLTKLPLERDLHFDRCDYTMSELLAMQSIPTCLRKPKEVAV
jgi:hypothetical protein